MESQGPVFHLFPRLPPELRLAIWSECLPHRVVELQRPLSGIAFDFQETPLETCKLELTTRKNSYPPIISRVCRESRAIAFETVARLGDALDDASENHWEHSLAMRDSRIDTARDIIHIPYERPYERPWDSVMDRPNLGNPLRHAACAATQIISGQVSIDIMLLLRPGLFYEHIIDLLRLRSNWLVVVYLVVVHMDPEASAATGLFGLLGDAPVQIVELRDEARMNAFDNLVLTSERRKPSAGQPLDKEELQRGVWAMEYAISEIFKEESDPAPKMYPAVMFRLCTEKCYQPHGRRGRKRRTD
ncbi:hypothetical protein F4776DRAFT_46362 [Hypoxylon sp. NC0597]|nr:hypothetical protein F4776DRAFT_46362 [Hypoxylon sp. NC0597]